MKIIKQGKSKEEIKAILKNEKQFQCATCDYDDRFTWRYKAAVLKLIGETNDEP